MDYNGFWQNVLLVLLGLLQQAVNLFIWERHKPDPDQSDEKPAT